MKGNMFVVETYQRKQDLKTEYMFSQLSLSEKYLHIFNSLHYMFLPEIKREFRAYVRGDFI